MDLPNIHQGKSTEGRISLPTLQSAADPTFVSCCTSINLCSPRRRNASDLQHIVTAVGSRSVSSAQKFIDDILASTESKDATPYGSYDEVFADKDVDAVYIGTPHTMHYENTKAALLAGKHVLCEKHPIAYKLQEVIFSGKYGKVKRIFADLSVNMEPDQRELTDRMIAPELGGGGLLDLGPYPMTMLLMHQHPDNKTKAAPSSIVGHMVPYARTGVDGHSTWIMEWKDVGVAINTASITTQMSTETAVIIQLESAEVHIDFPTYRPQGFTVIERSSKQSPKEGENPALEKTHYDCPIPETDGRGMQYQADEVARCIRDGKKESERCNLAESRIVMHVFDEVRRQGKYPVREGKAGPSKSF
ncbi:hypothetical protein QFC19_001693 [Naganishia cerealis]|uniref:Uncharacterized protein n=1 Tax=Naganishia cerealis TaxID=610337 RepID=A0ACC2WEV2_9TREE|nr:hypothetical protein QFC19_001693 [Naganishia cerealis]